MHNLSEIRLSVFKVVTVAVNCVIQKDVIANFNLYSSILSIVPV